MRELKFRVWDNENKSYDDPYSYAYYALTQDGGLDFYCHGDHMKEADPDVYFIEQYTGLKDKNGKEICEGDIIRCHGEDRFIASVIRHDKSGGFCWVSCYDETCFIPESDEVEIIGNIHENPELVEEEE